VVRSLFSNAVVAGALILVTPVGMVAGRNNFSSYMVIGTVERVNHGLHAICVKQASIRGYTETFSGCYAVAPEVELTRVRRGDSVIGVLSREERIVRRLRVISRHR